MQTKTKISIWCERFIEAGWLLALTLVPLYFNLFSARHFEPDKVVTLRTLVLLMLTAGLVLLLDRVIQRSSSDQAATPEDDAPAAGGNPFAKLWQNLLAFPLALPVLLYALVYILTTFTSVVPQTSFWGSYQRLQGTYTHLSYIGLFLMIVLLLRHHEQLERLITVMLMAGLAVAGYGVLQHNGLDPLPWGGDVVTRVASTMGNAIFVAAYMIMVVPFALFRTFDLAGTAARAPRASNPSNDLLRALAGLLLVGGTMALLLSVIKFGAVVRTADLRYWWVMPAMIAAMTALWAAPHLPVAAGNGRYRPAAWPGLLFAAGLLFFAVFFAVSSGSQVIDERITGAADWWLWLLFGSLAIAGFYGLSFTVGINLPGEASRLSLILRSAGYALLTLVLLLAIVYTQSRGPWLGLGAALFVFISLALWQGWRQARKHEANALAGRLKVLIWIWGSLSTAAIVFLLVFNLSSAPVFEQLRQTPFIGRLGQMLDASSGTGLVRRLIWSGDEHGGGAIALITSDPLRAVIGWGPESMFVAFNPFYPPDLTAVEARGASPDRSHQALLDEAVTRGLLGLVSFFFLLFSALALGWRLMRNDSNWRWQLFFLAAISAIVAHIMEGLTGIPVVSSLMMFWVSMALLVSGGAIAGHYRLPTTGVVPEPDSETEPLADARRKSGRRGKAARGTAGRRRQPQPASSSGPAALATYALIGALALGAVWWLNIRTAYADMRFQEGQAISERPDGGLSAQILGMEDYLATIRSNPREDFYYLNLGRTLMTIADTQRQQLGTTGEPVADANLDDLLQLENAAAIQGFISSQSPEALMSYAEAVLKEALALNPLNKDHYANLGRLHNFWYSWSRDPVHLEAAADWYEQVAEIAPQDVTLINERANVLAQYAVYLRDRQADPAAAEPYFDQAQALLERSQELDDRYIDTDARLANLYRLRGELEPATELYVAIIEEQPHLLDQQIETISQVLADRPELLQQVRDAYSAQAGDDGLLQAISGLLSLRIGDADAALESYRQAVALEPNNLEFRRNYTLVLSDTQNYAAAVSEAQQTLALAQAEPGRENEAAQLEALIAFLQQKAAGGQ